MNKITYYFALTTTLIISCLLTGCSQITTKISDKVTIEQQQYNKIAKNYLNQAESSTDNNTKIEYQLKAIENFILAEDLNAAEKLTSIINTTQHEHNAFLHILKTQIAIQKKQIGTAKKYIQYVWAPKQLPQELQIKFYQTRAELYLRIGNNTEAGKRLCTTRKIYY